MGALQVSCRLGLLKLSLDNMEVIWSSLLIHGFAFHCVSYLSSFTFGRDDPSDVLSEVQ